MSKTKTSDCWYTPPQIVNLVQQCLSGITLDPCADDGKHIEACYHLTATDDGLSHQWSGRVFMNPPYSCPGIWIAKLQEEFGSGRVEEAIALVPVATDTKWFHPLISSNLICFWKGRIKFLDVNYQPKMAARQSHCLVYWGKNQSRFRQIFSPFGNFNFLEEKEATECNSHNLTSAQELEPVFVMEDSSTDLSSSEPQRLTNTAQASLNYDIQELTTAAMCKHLLTPEVLGCYQEQSISSQLPHPALHSLQKDNDLEAQMSETVSPASLKPLENCNLNLQPLKMSQDLSPVPITQDSPQAHISEAWSVPLTSSGTMRNGLLSAVDTLPAPTLESEYCWLRSPGALSLSGKGRPPGQTKQEAELKKLGLINKGEVLNPAILCQWYEIPDSWLDPLECRAATELLEECDRQQEIFSILESQRSPLTESSISTPCAENQPLARANAKAGTYIINQSESLAIIKDNLGFGFVVEWLSSSDQITYNWERDDEVISRLAIASQHLIDKFFSQGETLKAIEDKSDFGLCEATHENFLEETKPATTSTEKSKSRQRKGCLYKYLENKKLKSGDIASYPRVIGHRQPDNPTHWRWGFNWEEKIDGEWKGRSIGSVPLGAIALIQSMQNEGISLEEIIGFIRRAKSKKC